MIVANEISNKLKLLYCLSALIQTGLFCFGLTKMTKLPKIIFGTSTTLAFIADIALRYKCNSNAINSFYSTKSMIWQDFKVTKTVIGVWGCVMPLRNETPSGLLTASLSPLIFPIAHPTRPGTNAILSGLSIFLGSVIPSLPKFVPPLWGISVVLGCGIGFAAHTYFSEKPLDICIFTAFSSHWCGKNAFIFTEQALTGIKNYFSVSCCFRSRQASSTVAVQRE